MGDVKDLISTEGAQKLKSLVDSADICMFTTELDQLPLISRPMSTMRADDDGTLWFFSSRSSNKNHEIDTDQRVQLFYANKSNAEYLSVYGTARVMKDDALAKELWSPLVKTWFPEGPEDPELTILRVKPEDAYYWDTKSNKAVALLKMVTGAVIGKTMDDGVEGRIKI